MMWTDDKTIWTIVNDNVDGVKEIIETSMSISPFGFPGKRIYTVKYKKQFDEIGYLKIDDETYERVYKLYNS